MPHRSRPPTMFGLAGRRLPPGLSFGDPEDFVAPGSDMGISGSQARRVIEGPGPGRLARFLSKPGLSDALLAGGAALLQQSDQPGTLGGAIGRALPVGFGAFQRGQAKAAVDEALEGAPESMRRLMQGLPLQERAMLGLQMMQGPAPRDPVSLDPGDVLVDPETGEQVAANPQATDPTGTLQNFAAWLQMTPEQREAFGEFMQTQRAPGTTVNVGQGPSPAEEALVDIEAGEVQAGVEQARTARGQLNALRELEGLLDEGVETGAGEAALLPAREIAAAFGVGDADQLIQQQNFRALSNEIAIGMTQGLEGQISERELDFVRAAVPNIGLTRESNRRLVQTGQRVNRAAIEIAEARRKYFRENGTLDGFETVRRRLVQELLEDLPGPTDEETDGNPFAGPPPGGGG